MSLLPFKSPFKKRKYEPQETFNTKFESAMYNLTGKFISTKALNHSLSKGEERESPLIEFFQQNLPKTFSVVKGEIVDRFNNSSQQLDLMIFDNSRNTPFYAGGSSILPAEALLASIEIKSKLTKQETSKILKSVNTLKSLKPFGRRLNFAKRQRDNDEKITCRYFHCVFAYDTDLGEDNWAKKEFDRIREVAKDEKIDYSLIDRLFVLKKGIINPLNSTGKQTKDDAESLLYFYMNILNFLQRENHRRQTVPYLDYAGKLSKGWNKLD